MMATVPNVISGPGLRKFQADGFLFNRVYISLLESAMLLLFIVFKNHAFHYTKQNTSKLLQFFSPPKGIKSKEIMISYQQLK